MNTLAEKEERIRIAGARSAMSRFLSITMKRLAKNVSLIQKR
jgi:hypothetical protein